MKHTQDLGRSVSHPAQSRLTDQRERHKPQVIDLLASTPIL